MFSDRMPGDLTPNRLTGAVARVRTSGRAIVDLTLSNPTHAGFAYPAGLLAPLGGDEGLEYAPQPLGTIAARRAVACEYRRRGFDVPVEHVALTASTSEAYGLLFKLLTNAGDEVLVPRPSYPLFDHLTRLELVAARPYDLEYHGRWSIDHASIERAWTPRTRAVLVVSPNNPTGSFITPDDLERLATLCAERSAALIADEVFADYELEAGAVGRAGRVQDVRRALTFSLGGLSKSVGLPQVKLGWIAVGGPEALVADALRRLEMVCDTYLSVSTPVQAAATALLRDGAALRAQIQDRIAANWRRLNQLMSASPACRVLHTEGGWSAVVQVPSFESEDDLVVDLLESDGVLVHPGYFFDFPRESYLVMSLLPQEAVFADGVERILRRFAGRREHRA